MKITPSIVASMLTASIVSLVCAPRVARADDDEGSSASEARAVVDDAPPSAADEPAPKHDRRVYVSFSPIHLLLPVVELTAEVRLHRHFGVAVIGGYGAMGQRPDGTLAIVGDNAPGTTHYAVWELGGQLVAYPIGHFDHGLQLGVEALYVGVKRDDSAGTIPIAAGADGFAAGPLVGYKLATKVGFTFNVQAGAEFVLARGDAQVGNASAHGSGTTVVPLLNMNVGWSF